MGVLLDFAAAHPADFPARGTFYVDMGAAGATDTVFGTAELASFKLQTLRSWGFEIGLLAPAAEGATGEQLAAELETAKAQLAQLLPGYEPSTVAVTGDGGLPATPVPTVTDGEDKPIKPFAGAVLQGGGLATSPLFPGVDFYRVPRLPAGEPGGATWRDAIGAAEIFVSGGE